MSSTGEKVSREAAHFAATFGVNAMNARFVIPVAGVVLVAAAFLLRATAERPILAGQLIPLTAAVTWPPPEFLR